MVGRCAHKRKAGCEVHTRIHSHGLERGKSLVVIHGEDAVEFHEASSSEESVGGIRTKRPDAGLLGFFYGRNYLVVFFMAEHTALACMGVERQHGYTRRVNSEVGHKRVVEGFQLFHHSFFCDMRRHL